MDAVTGTPEYHSNSKKPLKETVLLAACFLCVFTSFQALQNLQSSLHQQNGLGVTSLALLYGTIFLTSFFTPAIVYNLGVKASLMVAWMGHCIYVVSNVYPHWATIIPGSILLGLISCPLWTSLYTYLSAFARVSVEMDLQKTPKKVTTVHAAFSNLNGIFSAIFSASQMIGNFVSSTILFQSSYNQSDVTPVSVTSQPECGADYCPHEGEGQHLAQPETFVIYILLGVFLILDLTGMGITWCCVRGLEQPRYTGRDVLRKLRSYWVPYGQLKMWLIVPLYLARGLIFSLHISMFTEAYVGCALGIRMVGFVMAVWGFTTMLSAALMGYAARFTGRRFQFAFTFTLDAAILVVFLWWRPHAGSGAALFVIAAMMGLVDAVWGVQSNALLAVLFPAIVDSAFSVSGTWDSLSVAATFLMARFMCPRTRTYIALALLPAAVLGYVAVEVVHGRSLKTFDRTDHQYALLHNNDEGEEEEEEEGGQGGEKETQLGGGHQYALLNNAEEKLNEGEKEEEEGSQETQLGRLPDQGQEQEGQGQKVA